ncbi:MAG: Nramp family divalent metal transporter [Bacteroidota bacterium]
MSSRFRSVLFWSILAAAFIGPGTVTTAARAGSAYGLGLLWALLFSILATVVLQEAAARITLGAGQPLGEIIGRRGQSWNLILFGVIALGCGAYQAGNFLGALAGLQLLGDISKWWLLLLGGVGALMLWSGNTTVITRSLAFIVALMGIVFCWVAFSADNEWIAWLNGLVPSVEEDATGLVIGLIGTTIVPYNLFLASGLSQGQDLKEMRFGLILAILIGGLITLAILLTGGMVSGEFSFASLAEVLDDRLQGRGRLLLGVGLFTAGLSSAVTAPLAAAVTGKSLLGNGKASWNYDGINFRLTWGLILLAGLAFALTDVKPEPAIIAAQALNGLILPLVAISLIQAVNDSTILNPTYRNPSWLNWLSLLIVAVTVFLGLNNIWAAAGEVNLALRDIALATKLTINTALSGLLTLWLFLKLPRT